MANKKIRVAPHSKESEMMVLGCMLSSINSMNIAADSLDEIDFYFTEHQIIFSVLKGAYRQDKPADVHLVCEELKRSEKLDAVGGASYVTTLAQYAGTSAYIEEYVDIIKSKAMLRKMVQAAQIVEKNALEEPQDVHGALDEAQGLFFKISQSANGGAGVLINELLTGLKTTSQTPFLKELQERQESFRLKGPEDPKITGIPTHYIDLDTMINGFNDSNLMILAGRPAMGKTALALNIAENVCFKNGMPVGIFSLEMTAEQLMQRMVCSQAEVESEKIRTGSLSGGEFQRIVAAVGDMQKHTMVIDDQPGLKITDLRARARRMKESYGIRFLAIDYLQLIAGSGSNRTMESRQNEISEISRMLKTLARELNIPILCMSQLSRKVEDRAGHRPMMSDLRESGCLTGDTRIQDAQTGRFYSIRELAERTKQTPIYVHAVDRKLKIGKHKMIKAFYSGRKKVFELKMRSGRSIKASANHPFLMLNGWTRLDQLKVGDHLALPRSIEIENGNTQENLDEFGLLAHLIGDGCILPNQPYHYTSEDEENLSYVSACSHSLFDIQPKRVAQGNWTHIYLPSPVRLTKGRFHPITEWYNKLGIERVRSYEKQLPQVIFESSTSTIAHFLQHLWATDGNISSRELKKRKPSAAIYYASSSKTLAMQVQHLLLRLEIQSTLKTVISKKGHRNMYNVVVQGAQSQISFLNQVNSAGKRGKLKQKLINNLSAIKTNPNNDIIPKLQELAESDVLWDTIVSITELGEEDVYDATVEGVHNFVANDILVHNSIEQDSDIVMLMLRRDYYDPNDKPGMAELIVAKNRHGGVGNINLSFIKELGQFRNYTSIQMQAAEDSFANI